YMVWISLLSSAVITGWGGLMRRQAAARVSRRTRNAGIAAALLSYTASWIGIVALTPAPIPLVSGLRGTGILFAVVIGVVFLRERLSIARLASIAATLVGTTMLKLSR